MARYLVSKTSGPLGPWGFDSLSFRFVPAWSSGKTRGC